MRETQGEDSLPETGTGESPTTQDAVGAIWLVGWPPGN